MNDLLLIFHTTWLGPVSAFVFGLILGSFFNVCIRRIPEDRSIVTTPSHCPHCQTYIPWYYNIPIVGYLVLRGRCHACAQRISPEYPIVELASGLMFLGLFLHYGLGLELLVYGTFLSLLFIISVIDLHHQIIPDELSLPGMVLGVGAALLTGDIAWWESVLGILLGGGIFFSVAWLYERMTGREGLGGGDIKLLGMLGAWLGHESILILVVLSTGVGSVVGVAIMAFAGRDMKTAIPFGPFLALAGAAYLFWGDVFRAVLLPQPL